MPDQIGDMMAKNQQNTIHDALLDFRFQALGGNALNGNDFVAWAKTHILEILDQLATDLTKSGMVVQIEELKLDLHLTVENDLFAESDKLRAAISQQIEAALKKAVTKNKASQISHAHHNANMVLGYLKQGLLKKPVSASLD